jgi:GR25 family glycosyltransferase involved in LPS biosynthesis
MKTLTDLFDYSYCINLDRRTDRWEECQQEFSKWNLSNVHRISAIDKNNIPKDFPDVYKNAPYRNFGNIGLILTNIQILKHAQKQNLPQILIMEDDVYFTPEINNIESLISYVPQDWDMLYIGGNHNYHNKGHRAQPIPVNEKVLKLQHTFTTHCVGIKSHMYDVLLDHLSTLANPIDVIYVNIQKTYNVYGIHPSVAKQRAGFSDIENQIRNYNNWII